MKAMQTLVDSVKAWGIDPELLEVWADNAKMTTMPDWINTGYSVSYTVNVLIMNTSIASERLLMHLSNWLFVYMPNENISPELHIEQLEGGKVDIGIKMDFLEDYILVPDEAGAWEVSGIRYALTSNFQLPTDIEQLGILTIVDNNTRDEIGITK